MTKVKRGFAEAIATEVARAGAERVEAPCAHYPVCGGCRFQDLAYEAQVAAKEEQVRDALRRIGGIAEPPLEPILPAESQFFHYRNKLEYSFTQTPDGPALGFHKAGRWDEVLEIESAGSRPTSATRSGNAVRDWAREERLRLRPGRRTPATSATSSSARAGTRARRSCCSSPRRARSSSASYFVEVLRASPRCARSTGR